MPKLKVPNWNFAYAKTMHNRSEWVSGILVLIILIIIAHALFDAGYRLHAAVIVVHAFLLLLTCMFHFYASAVQGDGDIPYLYSDEEPCANQYDKSAGAWQGKAKVSDEMYYWRKKFWFADGPWQRKAKVSVERLMEDIENDKKKRS